MLRISKLALVSLLVTGLAFAQSHPKFVVKVRKDKVKAGEVFEYKIRAGMESKESPKIAAPEFKHFQVVSQSTARNYSYEKGRIVITVVLDYTLLSLKEGKFNLPQAVIIYKGEVFKSPLKKIIVIGKAAKVNSEKGGERKIPRSLLEGGVSI